MNYWNEIYSHFSPIAFEIFGIKVHWYGMAYVAALLIAYFSAKYFARTMPRFKHLQGELIDSYFFWCEIGVVVGARFGYLLIYTDDAAYYLTQPWQAFNPYIDGEFVGIAGMSYHGAVFGFLLASFVFSYVRRVSILSLLDLIALSVPLAYIFGRLGNFLNKELYGRVITNENWQFLGIYVEGAIRYPSQLIEGFLEGFVVFFVVYFAAKKVRTQGLLIVVYAFAYGVARFIAEYFRQPDSQMGVYFLNLSMGQILSVVMMLVAVILLVIIKRKSYGNSNNFECGTWKFGMRDSKLDSNLDSNLVSKETKSQDSIKSNSQVIESKKSKKHNKGKNNV
ncbi:prolipoprotein diacylglyceryl transferase [Helicobacter saguini]|uniref:Phosphatidylglycerol--prolipoprotein diacylglyceryl transferase n=1 Tax=Helicobacter saguini TaxID=1548018 RepID=A0A347VGY9_9HELI|nr:prolipoprotein diacylglyceryl transferase [Helicobacter saguini]MWV67242.1 prolipoprotein diacylglyceryl transferase [Helicobacter saguini]MWV69595.1 prolipoprotein diacylglyceryl transferase [Helicobacter saguini]MWV70855.1 prolipoprotein diacylglyceryl transferase [Helicobacter saguini]TLD94311.1 prolipoprotein diacylglyceryl transferase [Helicobacter saguini]